MLLIVPLSDCSTFESISGPRKKMKRCQSGRVVVSIRMSWVLRRDQPGARLYARAGRGSTHKTLCCRLGWRLVSMTAMPDIQEGADGTNPLSWISILPHNGGEKANLDPSVRGS